MQLFEIGWVHFQVSAGQFRSITDLLTSLDSNNQQALQQRAPLASLFLLLNPGIAELNRQYRATLIQALWRKVKSVRSWRRFKDTQFTPNTRGFVEWVSALFYEV